MLVGCFFWAAILSYIVKVCSLPATHLPTVGLSVWRLSLLPASHLSLGKLFERNCASLTHEIQLGNNQPQGSYYISACARSIPSEHAAENIGLPLSSFQFTSNTCEGVSDKSDRIVNSLACCCKTQGRHSLMIICLPAPSWTLTSGTPWSLRLVHTTVLYKRMQKNRESKSISL